MARLSLLLAAAMAWCPPIPIEDMWIMAGTILAAFYASLSCNFASLGLSEGELGFADSRATTDLTAFFHLKHAPRPFTTVAAPKSAAFFINDPRPPEPPDND
jgi:hypothetical protein